MDIEFRAYKLSEIETREKENTGYFSGYASVFGNQDSCGTIVDKGAFKKTIKDNKGIFPILFFHDPMVPVGIGPFQEDSKGLLVKDGELDLDVESGRNVYSGIKRGYIDRLSIGFTRITEQLVDKVVHLKELKLWEASLITRNFAANELALISDVRAVTTGTRRVDAALRSGATLELQEALNEMRDLLASLGEGLLVPKAEGDIGEEILEQVMELHALLRGDGPPDGTPVGEEPHLGDGPREHPDPLLEGFRQLGQGLRETLEETR